MKHLFLLFATVVAFASCAPKAQDAAAEAPEQSAPVKVNHAEYTSTNVEGQQRVYDYLKANGPFFITTVDGDQPRVRPFGALHIFEGKMYIITGHVKRIAKQLAANPKVEVCAVSGTEWVRVAATLVEDERVEAKKSMLDANPNLRSSYNENDDNIAVYYFTDATATFSSFAGDGDVVKF